MTLPAELAALFPPDTAEAWEMVAPLIPAGTALYGGTALAAHLHHRTSRDLDFFLAEPVDLAALAELLDRTRPLAIETLTGDTLNGVFGRTRVQFLHAVGQRELAPPTTIAGIPVAGVPDLLATKLKVLLDRPELRDYFDLMCIEQRTPFDVVAGLGFYVARYGDSAELTLPEIVRALGYFDDVSKDPGVPATREVIAAYWERRQPHVIEALDRR